MVAVMTEYAQVRVLEPEGRGHELMLQWGLHRRGGERTRSPISSGSWSEPLDPCHDDEPPFVVEIDDVLRGLVRGGYEQSVDIAKVFYLEHPRYDYWQVAQKCFRTDGFVRLTLRGICALVEQKVSE